MTEYIDSADKTGKIVYEYDYSNLQAIQSERFIEEVPLRPIMHRAYNKKYREWSTGQLIRKSFYDNTNSLKQKEEYTYLVKEEGNVNRIMIYPRITNNFRDPNVGSWPTIRTLKAGKQPTSVGIYLPGGIAEVYQYDGRFSFTSGCKLLSSVNSTDYRNNNYTTQTTYKYNKYLLHEEVIETVNNQKQYKQILKYPHEFTVAPFKTMADGHFLSPVIQQTIWMDNQKLYDTYTPYRLLDNQIPVPDRIETGKGNNPRETRIVFDQYNTKGQILEMTKDNTKVSYLWAYNSLYPVVEAMGVGYSSLSGYQNNLLSRTDSAFIAGTSNTIRSALKGSALVTSYTYKPLVGTTSVTLPNGTRKSFVYDSKGDLKAELDHNRNPEKVYEHHVVNIDNNGMNITFNTVERSPVYYANINHSSSGNKYYMEANVVCAEAVRVGFRLVYSTNSQIDYYINNVKYSRRGDSNDLIYVDLPAGTSRVYVSANSTDNSCCIILEEVSKGSISYPSALCKNYIP